MYRPANVRQYGCEHPPAAAPALWTHLQLQAISLGWTDGIDRGPGAAGDLMLP